jgi:hypothetical protein
MLDLAQAVREQIVKETPPRKGETPRVMLGLRRLALWGATAAAAVLLVVISSHSKIGQQRLLVVLQGSPPPAVPVFDAQIETRRLSDAVRALTTDNTEIKTHLAAVEHDMDDVTGSVSKQIEAASAESHAIDGPTVIATAALSTAMVRPPMPPPPLVLAAAPATAPAAADDLAPPPLAYGADIGSGLTILALRARWELLRSAHPELFQGMRPIVSVKEIPRANRVELRLVVGPLREPAAAVQLCALLTPFGLFCQPTVFDGQRLAMR